MLHMQHQKRNWPDCDWVLSRTQNGAWRFRADDGLLGTCHQTTAIQDADNRLQKLFATEAYSKGLRYSLFWREFVAVARIENSLSNIRQI